MEDAASIAGVRVASHDAWRRRLLRFFVGRSLDECIESRRDNILLLRLAAALMVVLGHSYAVYGAAVGAREPLHYLFPKALIHITGVITFFMISGLLITLSWLRRPELGRYMRARALRLWPALMVCLLLTAFVLGPLVTSLPLHDYFFPHDSAGTPFGYVLRGAIFDIQWYLPGVFTSGHTTPIVNASLWTLAIEATMYVCVAAMGCVRAFRFPWIASAGIAVVFSVIVLRPMFEGEPPVWPGYVLAGFFGAGCIACLLRRYIRISSGIALLVLIACVLSRFTSHEIPFTWLAEGYFALWFAYVPRLPQVMRGIDVSYGTYLWAFPIQQLLITASIRDPLLIFAVATPLALAMGAASWFFVERPALTWKDARSTYFRIVARTT